MYPLPLRHDAHRARNCSADYRRPHSSSVRSIEFPHRGLSKTNFGWAIPPRPPLSFHRRVMSSLALKSTYSSTARHACRCSSTVLSLYIAIRIKVEGGRLSPSQNGTFSYACEVISSGRRTTTGVTHLGRPGLVLPVQPASTKSLQGTRSIVHLALAERRGLQATTIDYP